MPTSLTAREVPRPAPAGPMLVLVAGLAFACLVPFALTGSSETGLMLATALLLASGFAVAFLFGRAARRDRAGRIPAGPGGPLTYRDAGGVLVLLSFAMAMAAAE